MNPQNQENKGKVRNIVIFSVLVASCGWLGYWLDKRINNPAQPLGMLLWLVAPLATVLLLRAFAGDGWKDFGLGPAFKGNAIWYALSLLIFPVVGALVLLLGALFGLFTFPNFSIALLLSVFGAGLLPSFFKNIFEEFSWRGYLTPKIGSLRLNAYVGYAITGLIWSSWHIPYWLYFLGPAQVKLASGQSLATFIPLGFLNLLAFSVAYGEIRLITNSVWPLVLLHTVGNALIDPLVGQGLVHLATGSALAPLFQALLTPVFFIGIGIWLHQRRVRQPAAG